MKNARRIDNEAATAATAATAAARCNSVRNNFTAAVKLTAPIGTLDEQLAPANFRYSISSTIRSNEPE